MSEAATLEGHKLLASGKVREIYEVDDDRLLMVASDRISTYDAVHPNPIPGKGMVLTGLSVFWFERTGHIVPNHLVSYTDVPDEARGRGLLVERLEMFPVECVVRGYITGSGWKDYQRSGEICGIGLPDGLRESDRLPGPIFPPAPSRPSRRPRRPPSATTTRTATSTAPPRSSATGRCSRSCDGCRSSCTR